MKAGGPAPSLSVVLATHNRAAILDGALRALVAQATPAGFRWELIVVDNNSTDATRATIEAIAAGAPMPVRYVFEGRLGKSRAVNTGLEHARADVIAFTDDDVRPAPDWVATAVGVLERWNAEAAGGRILPLWQVPPPSWLVSRRDLMHRLALLDSPEPTPLSAPLTDKVQVWGANMVFRRALLDHLGGFDTGYGPVGRRHYNSEDIDLVMRALAARARIVYDPALTVFHLIGPERMRPRYFYKWEYDGAEGEALKEPLDLEPRLWGAPRALYEEALVRLCHWLYLGLARRRPDDLDAGRVFWKIAGRIRGLQKRSRPPSEHAAATSLAPRPASTTAHRSPTRPAPSRETPMHAQPSTYARTNVQLYNQLAREGYSEAEVARVAAAYRLAVALFASALRPAGQPFLAHLVATASILASLRAPVELVAAGLLHSTYTHGEFGNGWQKMTAERRGLVRSHVGDDVEQLIARYTTLRWNTRTAPAMLAERFDELDGLDRKVLLIRLANELDEHLDLNALHCGDAERRQREAGSTLLPCVSLAERLGASALAAELERALKETVSGQVSGLLVEPLGRSTFRPPLSHVPRLKVRLSRLLSAIRE